MSPFWREPEFEEPDPTFLRGMRYTLNEADHALAARHAVGQDMLSQDRGTRDAGADYSFRLKGVTGEIVVARLLGIAPQVRVSGGPEKDGPDIFWEGDWIEVKNGLPMEAKSKLRDDCWYVTVGRINKDNPDLYEVRSVIHGWAITQHPVEPPAHWCPRPGTRELNVRIDIVGEE